MEFNIINLDLIFYMVDHTVISVIPINILCPKLCVCPDSAESAKTYSPSKRD